ncbi:MAG: TonB-dependent receptor [Chitinispirillaceae bacterium]|nr:TonB-dependent receptor [Chitinispirillaceae bacterium]
MGSVRRLKMLSMVISILLAPVCFFTLPAEATAPAGNAHPAVEDIEYLDYLLDLTVTSGSFLDLNLEESPFSMSVISREEITFSGARTLSELLEIFVPGFQYMFNKWNGTLWGMRGIANDRNTKIIFLINGHKMNTQARDGFQGETVLGLFGDIERIEVLRGPAGLVYGSGAMAGIINVVTRATTGNSTELQTRFTTAGSQAADFSLHAIPAENQTIAVSAGFLRSDGLPAHQSRIYGSGALLPNTDAGGNTNGLPADGNYGSTDGNIRLSGEWTHDRWSLYLRATRQKENAGAFFLIDPWPEKSGTPDSTFEPRIIDGKLVTYDHPYWKQIYANAAARLQYQSDNLLAECKYLQPVGSNELHFKIGADRNTTRINVENRPGYEDDPFTINPPYVASTFGEVRLSANAMYLLKSVSGLQLATGAEYRLDHIGDDMEGKCENDQNPKNTPLTAVDYHTFSLFSEGLFEVSEKLDIHMGGRLDFHTRAFMANPKVAFIYTPARDHALKLICQSASNNGSADNYEYNRFHHDQNGNLSDSARFALCYQHPTTTSELMQPIPPIDSLHKLRPEKVYSVELIYAGILFNHLTVAPSASVGYVKDIFGWSQKLFRVVNAGNYKYADIDLDAKFEFKKIIVGASHTYQRPIFTDVNKQQRAYKIFTLDTSGVYYDSVDISGTSEATRWHSDTKYIPVLADEQTDYPINHVKETITADGQNFLNLNTHITKCYATYRPFDWLTFHGNLRLFWGLPGRSSLYAADSAVYNYLGITEGSADRGLVAYFKNSVSKKVNLSLHLHLPHNFDVAFYVYDLLGIDHPYDRQSRDYVINTIRWSYMYAPVQKELYSTDQRSFGLSISKTF